MQSAAQVRSFSGTGRNLTLEGGGTGVLTLSGANTYTGTTTLTAGTINLGVAENANVSGPLGTQLASAAGTIVLSGGRLQCSAANQFDYSGRFSTASNQASSVDTNGESVTWATNLASTGGTLTKTGAGNLTLSGTNSYDGGSTITTGALVFRSTDSKAATGTQAFAAGTTRGMGVATSGSFFTSADVDNAFAGTMAGNLSNVTVTDTTNVGIDTTAGDFTYAVIGSPTKGLAKFGTNNLTLNTANTYTGATNLNAGTLTLTAANNISSSSGLSLAYGTTLQLRNDADTNFAIPNVTTSVVAGGTYNFDLNQATVAGSARTLTLGNITFATATALATNQINVTGGNSYILELGTISATSGDGAVTHPVIVNATTADVTIASFIAGSFGSGQVTFSGVIQDPASMDATSDTVTKSGAGTIILSNSNAYTGTPTLPSYPLFTAFSIAGTPTLAVAVSGYSLQVVSNELRLVSTGGGPGPLDNFAITAIGSPQTVGTPVTGMTLTTRDAANQTVTSFNGAVNFGGTGGFTGTSGTFTAGVLSGVSVIPTNAGSGLTFTVTDIGTGTGTGKSGSATITTIQTQYQGWSGGAPFASDANSDGVSNGMAFLLGAASPSASALGLVPTVTQTGGGLALTFNMPNAASRGTAALSVQHSSDLGIGVPWEAVIVPSADSTVNDVVFVISGSGPRGVQTTFPSSKAAADTFRPPQSDRIIPLNARVHPPPKTASHPGGRFFHSEKVMIQMADWQIVS
jgi:fibronectin-binding autotransporter adhesin